MPAWLDTLLVSATVSVALGYLLRGWIRRARNKGAACGAGCCCPALEKPNTIMGLRGKDQRTAAPKHHVSRTIPKPLEPDNRARPAARNLPGPAK